MALSSASLSLPRRLATHASVWSATQILAHRRDADAARCSDLAMASALLGLQP
jgi:hypothetical protein